MLPIIHNKIALSRVQIVHNHNKICRRWEFCSHPIRSPGRLPVVAALQIQPWLNLNPKPIAGSPMSIGPHPPTFAPERTRTSNPLRERRSKRRAYTNSATGAIVGGQIPPRLHGKMAVLLYHFPYNKQCFVVIITKITIFFDFISYPHVFPCVESQNML